MLTANSQYVNAIGSEAAQLNNGDYINAIGFEAVENGSNSYVIGVGHSHFSEAAIIQDVGQDLTLTRIRRCCAEEKAVILDR